MSYDSYGTGGDLEPGSFNFRKLITNLVVAAVVVAPLAVASGFGTGQLIAGGTAMLRDQLDLSSSAISQFDEILTAAGGEADTALQSLTTFAADNEISLAPPRAEPAPQKIEEGDASAPKQPLPAPTTNPAVKSQDQIVQAYNALTRLQNTLNVSVEVPDTTASVLGSIFTDAFAKASSHSVPVKSERPHPDLKIGLYVILAVLVLFSAVLAYSLFQCANNATDDIRKFFGRLAIGLVCMFVLLAGNLLGAMWGLHLPFSEIVKAFLA